MSDDLWANAMITVPTPPFIRDGLTSLVGFPVPASFVAVLNALCHDCESAEAACERIDDALGWDLAGDEQRYTQTPPELFPIAGTGVDGGHFGYVILAPELVASDYPIARFEPMDSAECICWAPRLSRPLRRICPPTSFTHSSTTGTRPFHMHGGRR